MINDWIRDYLAAQRRLLAGVDPEQVAGLVRVLYRAWREERQVFAFGNGGSAANCSHFAVDLGKGSWDALGRRCRVISLDESVAGLTALGNNCAYGAYEDVFSGQLQN